MSDLAHRLTDEFTSLLADYLMHRDESVLERAYELGRKAVRGKLTVVDMVAIQQDALVSLLLRTIASEKVGEITKGATEVFSESLAPFELARRSSQEGNITLRHLKDALEQRVAEQTKQIQRERDFAQKLIETAQVIILVLDKDGRVIQYNPFMEKLSGYRSEEMRGTDWCSTFLPERDRSRVRQLFSQVLSERDTGGINPIVAQDGTERLIEWSFTILKDGAGNAEGLLCIGQDITEKTRLQEKVIEKERLAAMSVTTAKLVHEIGNPLNGMSLTAQLLRSRVDAMTDTDSAIKSGLDRLIRETTRLNQLIREFKFFFASERQVFKPVSLATVAAETLEVETATYATRHIKVEQSLPENLPLMMGDADKLKQAILNLCKNAVEAMPEGGTLSVRGFASGDHVIFEVADTGVGIPRSVDVLTPFTTTKASGSGLGLMIVRQIVSTHGGTLTYTSEPDKGTVFRLAFPVIQSATPVQ